MIIAVFIVVLTTLVSLMGIGGYLLSRRSGSGIAEHIAARRKRRRERRARRRGR